MQLPSLRLPAFAFAIGMAALVFCGGALADPPSRVARLGFVSGAVSFSPAGESDWVQASMNRPLTTGDRLWADARGRAEIQVGNGMVRMNAGTSLAVLNLDDQIVQLQLTQGTLHVRVRSFARGQVFEVDTPNLAFTLRQAGEYRIVVDTDSNATTLYVRKGQGEAYGDGASYIIDVRQPYRFTGTDLREYDYVNAAPLDEFDRWAADRDRRYDGSISARYVSQDVLGYQDLDANGSWRVDAAYGNVWYPSHVASGWAPYRDGHWAWVDPWGWTWVDDAPWGFAVSHYGRWASVRGSWCWVPGPARSTAWYAPALVVFLGGANFQLSISGGNVGGIAWFPLGPREVYRPTYAVSRSYFENINRSNTIVNTTIINNYYNNSNVTNVVYANRRVAGAVVAVPATAFIQSQPVGKAAVRVAPDVIASRPVAFAPPLAPTERSVHGATATGDKPPARAFERQVVARTAPPAAHVGFAAQQPQLAAKPGQPLDEAARRQLKPAAPVPQPVVKVVPPAHQAQPTSRPPAQARPAPATPAAPAAPQQGERPALQRQPAPPAPAAQPQEQRRQQGTQPEQRPAPEPRAPAVAPARQVERPAAVEAPARQVERPAAVPPPARQVERPATAPPPARQVERPAAVEAPARQIERPVPAPSPGRQAERPVPVQPPARQAEPLRTAPAPEPKAQQRAQEPRAAASRPNEKNRDREEPDRGK